MADSTSRVRPRPGQGSSLEARKLRIDPCFDEFVKLCRFLENLLRLGVCRDVGARVVDHVPLATASLEVVGVLLAPAPSVSVMASKATLWWPALAVTRYPAHAITMCAARSAALYAVANRRSADRAVRLASARSRAISARISSSSFLDVRCL